MANEQHITDFINGFNGGNRTNRFKVTADWGDNKKASYCKSTPFHIRSTNLPSAKIGIIPVSYRGRVVNYPGDRTYDPWTVLILDDNSGDGGSLYNGFHEWHNSINSHDGNISYVNGSDAFNKADLTIDHLGVNGDGPQRTFKLVKAWPVEVGPVQLDIGQMDTLVTFQVTFLYTHYAPLKTQGGNAQAQSDTQQNGDNGESAS